MNVHSSLVACVWLLGRSSSDERSKGKTRGGSENGGEKRIEIAKKPFVPVIKEVIF